MSFTKQFKETMKKVFAKKDTKEADYKAIYQKRLIEFRKLKTTVTKLEKPTNIVRARELGYKAKKGIFVVLVNIRRGTGLFRQPIRGRKPRRVGFTKLTRNISIQSISEQRASRKYPNCEVLNSYFVGEDGKNKYYEVIMLSKNQQEVKKDKNLKAIIKQTGRAERGLTSSAKKTKGLRKIKETNRK